MDPAAIPCSPPEAIEAKDEQPRTTCYPNWKPMPVPPHDLINVEALEEQIKKEWFKADNLSGFLYDETGNIDLPVDKKGILVVDPVTRTRLEDVYIEYTILGVYAEWIIDTVTHVSPDFSGIEETREWLQELLDTIEEDRVSITAAYKMVVDEERKKRGLSGFEEWVAHFNRVTYPKKTPKDKKDDDHSSEQFKSASPEPQSDTGHLSEVEHIAAADSPPQTIFNQPTSHSPLGEDIIFQHPADEHTPLISHTEDEPIQTYCCGCCLS